MVCTVIHSFIFSLAKVASTASFRVSFCSTFQLSFGCDTRYYNCDHSYGEFIAVVYFRCQKFSFRTHLERKNRRQKSESENRRRFMAPVSGACLGLKGAYSTPVHPSWIWGAASRQMMGVFVRFAWGTVKRSWLLEDHSEWECWYREINLRWYAR